MLPKLAPGYGQLSTARLIKLAREPQELESDQSAGKHRHLWA
jgi:hypothetical protein